MHQTKSIDYKSIWDLEHFSFSNMCLIKYSCAAYALSRRMIANMPSVQIVLRISFKYRRNSAAESNLRHEEIKSRHSRDLDRRIMVINSILTPTFDFLRRIRVLPDASVLATESRHTPKSFHRDRFPRPQVHTSVYTQVQTPRCSHNANVYISSAFPRAQCFIRASANQVAFRRDQN